MYLVDTNVISEARQGTRSNRGIENVHRRDEHVHASSNKFWEER